MKNVTAKKIAKAKSNKIAKIASKIKFSDEDNLELAKILTESKIEKVRIGDLSFLKGINRDVNYNRAEKIGKSILNLKEFLAVFVVAKNPNAKGYIILDAQHRFSVFDGINRDIEVNCVVSKAETVEDIVKVMKLLNSTSSKWVLENYINAFAGLGNKDYVVLKEALKENVLTTATLPMVFTMDSRSQTKTLIEDGFFKIINKNWKETLKQISEIKAIGIIPESGNGKRIYTEALVSLVLSKNYNHAKFVNNLKEQKPKDFILQTSAMESNGVVKYLQKIAA